MADDEQLERLTALLTQQSEQTARREEQAAQREERLASLLERMLASQEQQLAARSDAAATGQSNGADSLQEQQVVVRSDTTVAGSGQSAGADTPQEQRPAERSNTTNTESGRSGGTATGAAASARLPTGAMSAPHLSSSASLKEFGAWRQKFADFKLLTRLGTLSDGEQKAALMSLLDDEWARTLRYSLPMPPGADLTTILDAMEAHLRGQRSIILDRRDFYSRIQEPDETFDDFVSSIKEIAAYCDFCDKCLDDQFRDRIVVGTRDEEALKRMLHEPKLTLQKAVDICRACESASANSAAILGEPTGVTRVSAYRRSRDRLPSDSARREDPCRRCGRTQHADGVRCPAMDASCRACGGSGHFTAACANQPPDRGARGAGRVWQGARSRDRAAGDQPPGRGRSRSRRGRGAGYGAAPTSESGAGVRPGVRQVVEDIHVDRLSTRRTPRPGCG